MKVEVGVIEGSQAMHHISQGWAITVVATVSELGLNNPDTAMIYNHALSALIGQVGDRGSPCPSIYVPTYLEQFIPEIISPDCVKIRIVYRGYPLPVIETSSVLSQVESNIDIYGNPIMVSYHFKMNYPYDLRKRGIVVQENVMVPRLAPETVKIVRWQVTAGAWSGSNFSTASDAMAYYEAMEGCINAATYTLAGKTGAPLTWLIEHVRGITRDGMRSYEAEMHFHYRSDGWDPMAYYKNPDTGIPPKDLVLATSPGQYGDDTATPVLVGGQPTGDFHPLNEIGATRPPMFPRIVFPNFNMGTN